MSVTLVCGDSSEWDGPRPDLVFTHPYGPLPPALHGVPAIINLYEATGWKQPRAERWLGNASLVKIGKWGLGLTNTVYVYDLPVREVTIEDLVEEEFAPGKGWMPLELPLRLLRTYAMPGITVWDGFCGRGTIGHACQTLNMNYIGIDRDPARIGIAKEYLGC